jgi:hypothetical protein
MMIIIIIIIIINILILNNTLSEFEYAHICVSIKPTVNSADANIYLIQFLFRITWKKEMLLSPLLRNFGLEHVIRKVHANQEVLKLNGTNHLLIYADHVNFLGENINNRKKSTETLIDTNTEIGLEINAGKISMYFRISIVCS